MAMLNNQRVGDILWISRWYHRNLQWKRIRKAYKRVSIYIYMLILISVYAPIIVATSKQIEHCIKVKFMTIWVGLSCSIFLGVSIDTILQGRHQRLLFPNCHSSTAIDSPGLCYTQKEMDRYNGYSYTWYINGYIRAWPVSSYRSCMNI